MAAVFSANGLAVGGDIGLLIVYVNSQRVGQPATSVKVDHPRAIQVVLLSPATRNRFW